MQKRVAAKFIYSSRCTTVQSNTTQLVAVPTESRKQARTFQFLAQCIVSLHEEKQVITTKGKDILCSPARNNTTNLAPCTHEEADTRMILHAAHAVQEGYRKIVLRTVDIDVLLLEIAFAGILQENSKTQLPSVLAPQEGKLKLPAIELKF